MKNFLIALTCALAAIALASVYSPRQPVAHAEIDGPCEATVNGQSVGPLSSSDADDAIEVEKDDILTVVMTSNSGSSFASHKVDLEIAGIKFNIEDDPDDNDPEWTEIVNVDDYATYGVGLYKVSGAAEFDDGTSCSGAVLIQIKGNPLTTVAGIAAIVIGAIGAAFLFLSAMATLRQFRALRKRIEEWGAAQLQRIADGHDVAQEDLVTSLRAIAKPPGIVQFWMIALLPAMMLMGASMPGGLSASGMAAVLRLPRLPLRPKFSALGPLGGAILGETIVTFLNFLAVQPLTGSNAVLAAVLGIALGVCFDSGVKWLGTRDVNKVIGRLEKQLDEARERQRKQGGDTPPAAPA